MSILINANAKVIIQGLTGAQHGLVYDEIQTRDLIENAQSDTHILCNCGDLS